MRSIAAAVAPPLSIEEFRRQMARARFCIVARGDSPMTSKLPEAILSGCIPIIVIEGPLPLESVSRDVAVTRLLHERGMDRGIPVEPPR